MHVELEQRGHLLAIGVRRPEKMNALSRDMYRALARAMHRLEHDPDLWVGVIWAEGPHFTSGVDLADWSEAFASGTNAATSRAVSQAQARSVSNRGRGPDQSDSNSSSGSDSAKLQ